MLVEQLLQHYRDLAAVSVGCPAELMHVSPTSDYEQILDAAKELGLATILASMQILNRTETLIRQRGQGRMQTEIALMQICNLENLDDLSSIVAWLRGGNSAVG
jgi:DNA polymerase III subunit gamma/tau